MMATTIARWGSGAGLHLPKDLLERARLKIGDTVELDIDGDSVKITPLYRTNAEKLEAMFAHYRGGTRCHETDWGDDAGRENELYT